MTLDEAIRFAFRHGATGLTIWPLGDDFQANVRTPAGGWHVSINSDPVAALFGALRQEPEPQPSGDLFE